MALRVTYQWSEERLSQAPPWTGTRVWIVSGTRHAETALTAVDSLDPNVRVATLNTPWTAGSPLVSRGPRILQRLGLETFKVASDYAIPDGGQIPDDNVDPLLKPAEYRWEQVELTIPADVDLDGSPIVNTAGFPLEPMPLTITYWILHAWRYEPEFDTLKADTYANAVNSEPLTLAGRPVAVEHCRCKTMEPEGVYQAITPYVRMHYAFEVFFGNQLGPYPFQHKVLNQGDSGWWVDDDTKRAARLSDGRGNVLSQPIRLDADGMPLPSMFGHVRVGAENKTPAPPPEPVTVYDYQETDEAVWLWFKRVKLANLKDLKL